MRIDYLADHQHVIPTLAEWFYREWAYLHPERSLQDVEALIAERTNKNEVPLALVAFEGDELVGTVCLKICDMETRSELTPWLAGLYVPEGWRGSGIGTKLIGAIEAQAKQLGIPALYLYTPDAEVFYRGLGWTMREKTEYHGFTVAVMEKRLSS